MGFLGSYYVEDRVCSWLGESYQEMHYNNFVLILVLSCSPNVKTEVREAINNIFNIEEVACHEKDLGFPSMVSKVKKKLFSSIKDRVWNKLLGWKEKLFSLGGKRDFDKISCPIYSNLYNKLFCIPSSLCVDLHRMYANF